jgi:hypothetical protein
MVILTDPEWGTVAAAIDADGIIVATAADSFRDGAHVVIDEVGVYEATGELMPIPPRLWGACTNDEPPPA